MKHIYMCIFNMWICNCNENSYIRIHVFCLFSAYFVLCHVHDRNWTPPAHLPQIWHLTFFHPFPEKIIFLMKNQFCYCDEGFCKYDIFSNLTDFKCVEVCSHFIWTPYRHKCELSKAERVTSKQNKQKIYIKPKQ